MATWVTHLRIAEILLQKYDFDTPSFLAGSIGPDSGVPDKTWTRFDPPKSVTHWIVGDDRIGKNIRSEDFYSKHLKESPGSDAKDPRRSFLLGYYAHLLTDIEWSTTLHAKMAEDTDFGRRFTEDPEFIWVVKRDWYGLDFKYLDENPDNIFTAAFVRIEHMPDFLDYFPEGAVLKQIRYIQNFYLSENKWVNKEFVYLTRAEMDDFVEKASRIIIDRFDRIL